MDRLPEYLRYTIYGQHIQRILTESTSVPDWINPFLIYDPNPTTRDATPIDATSDSEDDFPMSNPRRIYIGPHANHNHLALPTEWDLDDKQDQLIARNGVIRVINDAIDNKEICLRGSSSIPTLCGTWYFEVTFDHSSRETQTCMVGLSSDSTLPSRSINLRGSQGHCWLYFSDDGRIMPELGTSRKYGPEYGPGDTIGCGINFKSKTIFYTKNGLSLGPAFSGVSCGSLYPFIGIRSGVIFSTNFGSEPFKYDIAKYVLQDKAKLYEKIDATVLEETSFSDLGILPESIGSGLTTSSGENSIVVNLVTDYLERMCYHKSAHLIKTEMCPDAMDLSDEPVSEDALVRQQISSNVLNGNFDSVIDALKTRFSDVLYLDNVGFDLACQRMAKAIRDDKLDLALDYGKELKAEYSHNASKYVSHQLKLLFGTLAYSRADGGAPYEEECYGPQALAELSTKIITAILASQGQGPAYLPQIIDIAVDAVEELTQLDSSASHINILQDIF